MLRERLATLQASVVPALAERLTLWLNHVIAGEAAALGRLRPHLGRVIAVAAAGTPPWLPPLPRLLLRVTPAALFERLDDALAAPPDLEVVVDLSNLSQIAERLLNARAPALTIRGDAALAADVGWLIDELRWDFEDDLERVVGPQTATVIARAGAGAAALARDALGALASLRRAGEPTAR